MDFNGLHAAAIASPPFSSSSYDEGMKPGGPGSEQASHRSFRVSPWVKRSKNRASSDAKTTETGCFTYGLKIRWLQITIYYMYMILLYQWYISTPLKNVFFPSIFADLTFGWASSLDPLLSHFTVAGHKRLASFSQGDGMRQGLCVGPEGSWRGSSGASWLPPPPPPPPPPHHRHRHRPHRHRHHHHHHHICFFFFFFLLLFFLFFFFFFFVFVFVFVFVIIITTIKMIIMTLQMTIIMMIKIMRKVTYVNSDSRKQSCSW